MSLGDFSGTGCTTSQCSTTLQFSTRRMSTKAMPRSLGANSPWEWTAELRGQSRGPSEGWPPWRPRAFKRTKICKLNGLAKQSQAPCERSKWGYPRLRARVSKPHIGSMSTPAKKSGRTHPSSRTGHAVVYRGVRIAPMSGSRSDTARAIRDALRTEYRHASGKETRD